jgi:5-methylcytosine-specific restriction enzyme A
MSAHRRPSSSSRGYDARWRALRVDHLRRRPLCVMCMAHDRQTPATIVDHIRPHRGVDALRLAPGNLQSLCKAHHDGAKQSQDRTGRVRGCDVTGAPLDPAHPWHVSREGVEASGRPGASQGGGRGGQSLGRAASRTGGKLDVQRRGMKAPDPWGA